MRAEVEAQDSGETHVSVMYTVIKETAMPRSEAADQVNIHFLGWHHSAQHLAHLGGQPGQPGTPRILKMPMRTAEGCTTAQATRHSRGRKQTRTDEG